MIALTLPFPPSTNRIWRQWKGRTLLSTAGRIYRDDVARIVMLARCAALGGHRLALTIDAWMPDRRRRDIDNLTKAVCDAMQHARVYEDDSQIDDLHIRRAGVDAKNPRLEIVVTPI